MTFSRAVFDLFGEELAASYEAWYETGEGQRADALEKAALRRLLGGFSGARPGAVEGSHGILEVGCGTGHFTRWLCDAGWRALGLELSAPMLRQARALNGVQLVQGDAAHLPFADDAFDVTMLITTLEFLAQPETALAEATRVAHQGLLLGVLNRWSVLALRRRLNGLLRPSVYDRARFYGVRELKRLLRRAADDTARIAWCTTLFPIGERCSLPWPGLKAHTPWGGFIAIAVYEA